MPLLRRCFRPPAAAALRCCWMPSSRESLSPVRSMRGCFAPHRRRRDTAPRDSRPPKSERAKAPPRQEQADRPVLRQAGSRPSGRQEQQAFLCLSSRTAVGSPSGPPSTTGTRPPEGSRVRRSVVEGGAGARGEGEAPLGSRAHLVAWPRERKGDGLWESQDPVPL